MPKLTCPCGGDINLSPIPCPDGYLVVHAPAWDELVDGVCEAARTGRPAEGPRNPLLELLSPRNPVLKEAYLCPTCQRLLVQDRDDGDFTVWAKETGDPQALLRRGGEHTEGAALKCPSCGNTEPENMVFVRQTRDAHRMRWARRNGVPDATRSWVEVEMDRISDQKILGDGQIECRKCYVMFGWPEHIQWMSLHPSNWAR